MNNGVLNPKKVAKKKLCDLYDTWGYYNFGLIVLFN